MLFRKRSIGILTQKEAEKAVARTVEGIGNIVRFSPPLRSLSDHRLRLISMRNKLENVPEDYLTEKREEGMVNPGYNKIYALLKQDEGKIAKVMKWELPVLPEKLAAGLFNKILCPSFLTPQTFHKKSG